jgi:peptide/nickel transport system substrate-binding protein
MKLWWYVFVIAFLFYGCKRNKKNESEKTVFRYNEAAGITSLDPAFARDQANIWAVSQIYNGLVQMDENLHIQPCIAKRWEVSNDGLIYTFILRNDVFFHDHPLFKNGKGRKVVASDFVNSFFRIIDETVASPGAWIFNYIDRSAKSNYLGFEAVNDTVLKIYLTRPYPPFLGLLTTPYCYVTPYEVVDYYGKDFRNNPVGTGPFKFKMWKEGVKLVLVKNENYFERDSANKPLPYLDAVAISFINDRQSEFLEFLKGNLDLLSGMDGRGQYTEQLIDEDLKITKKYADKFVLESEPYLNTEYLGILLNDVNKKFKNNPLKDKLIRKAINYAINRNELVNNLRGGIGIPANKGIVPIGMPGFKNIGFSGYEYNPKKSLELLAEAGYPNGKGLPEIVLSCTEKRKDIFEYIQHQLNLVGIKSRIDINPAAVHRQFVARSLCQVFWASWIADYPDAENYFALFYSKNQTPIGPNTTRFSNKYFDNLYERSQSISCDSIRFKLYHEMDQLLIDEAPVVPLYYDQVIRVYPKTFKNLKGNPMNLLVLKNVYKAKS